MGWGDNIMASGMARGAAMRGRRIAFGDGTKIRWDQFSEMIFRGNPNIASPQQTLARNLEWIHHYKGHRLYNSHGHERWIWNYDFKATPGEVFLSRLEMKWAENNRKGFVVIEPSIPSFKSVGPNKQWPVNRYEDLAGVLRKQGFDVVQMVHPGAHNRLHNARHVDSPGFRHALALLSRAALYIGPEGGLHHGAAAVGVPAVVLFGGFIPPSVTGYDTHTNLTGGTDEACGSFNRCEHCIAAMNRIGVDEVHVASMRYLEQRAA